MVNTLSTFSLPFLPRFGDTAKTANLSQSLYKPSQLQPLFNDTVKFGLTTVTADSKLDGAEHRFSLTVPVAPPEKEKRVTWADVLAAKILATYIHTGQMRDITRISFAVHPDGAVNTLMLFVKEPSLLELYGTALHDGIEDQGESGQGYAMAKENGLISPELDALIKAVSQKPKGIYTDKKTAFVQKLQTPIQDLSQPIVVASDGRVNGQEAAEAIIAVLASDKIDGAKAIIGEIDSGVLTKKHKQFLLRKSKIDGQRDNIQKPFLEYYYQGITQLLLDHWNSIGQPDRLAPLMHELAATTTDFSERLRRLSEQNYSLFKLLPDSRSNPLLNVAMH